MMRIAAALLLVCASAAVADDLFPLDPSSKTKSLPELLAMLQTFKVSEAQRQQFLQEFQKKSPEEQRKLLQQLAGLNPGGNTPQPGNEPGPGIDFRPKPPPLPPGIEPDKSRDPLQEPGRIPPRPGPTPSELPGSVIPPQQPTDTKANLKQSPGLGKFADIWEKNVGPLEKTPELQKALLDMAKSADFTAGSGDGKQGEDLLKFLESSGIESSDLKNWIDGLTPSGGWKLPETGVSAPPVPSVDFGGLGNLSLPDLNVAAVAVLAAVAAAVFLGLRYLPERRKSSLLDLSRAAWPVAPKDVADRATLVKAFEFLSVQLCGDAARVWHHRTIAGALRTGVVAAEPVADRLADLYELARYSPPDEPLPATALAEARRCLVVLAGARA